MGDFRKERRIGRSENDGMTGKKIGDQGKGRSTKDRLGKGCEMVLKNGQGQVEANRRKKIGEKMERRLPEVRERKDSEGLDLM
jgi:hypothetical protein